MVSRQNYACSEPEADRGRNHGGGWLHVLVTTTMETPPLTTADRCDRCGAQAYVRVTLPAGELLFCAHHAREHADRYKAVATHIQDETARLFEPESAS